MVNSPYSLDYVLTEVTNAIWKECALRKRISLSDATANFGALQLLTSYTIITEPSSLYMKDGLKAAINEKTPIYDMLYIMQAKKHGGLLTSDLGQKRLADKMGVKTIFVN